MLVFQLTMTTKKLSDEEILKLWKDPEFSGSFLGLRGFKLLLKTDLGYDVPENRLRQVLNREPIFLIHQRRPKKLERRKFFLSAIGMHQSRSLKT